MKEGLRDRHHLAVIGDGAMTAGMVFEAMNCAEDMKDAFAFWLSK